MVYMGLGLAKNCTLEKLSLSENNFAEKECIHLLVKGLLDNIDGSKVFEIEIQRSRISSKTAEPFADLFEKNFKIRSLNLRNNVINDEGAKLLLHAIVRNDYICKFSVDLNPINHKIINEIEKHTKENQLKVSEQEVPKMIKEVIEIKKETA